MKNIVSSFVTLFATLSVYAGTPAEELVENYKDVKGARNLVAKGALVRMVRPMMKDYQIAPLAHKVEELSVLNVDKISPEIKTLFLRDLKDALGQYIYAGQSVTRNGIVDAYVHMGATDVADELVVYNPEIFTLYSLSGTFTRQELEKIQKKP